MELGRKAETGEVIRIQGSRKTFWRMKLYDASGRSRGGFPGKGTMSETCWSSTTITQQKMGGVAGEAG